MKTAVEWLNEQMNNIKGSSISMNGRVQFIEKEFNEIFEKAKEMEKEQIKNAWIATDNELQRIAAEEYYNRTYNI